MSPQQRILAQAREARFRRAAFDLECVRKVGQRFEEWLRRDDEDRREDKS
jgi:hypothetical protein